MDTNDRHYFGVGLVGVALLFCVSCGASQDRDGSDSLTDRTPARLATDEKRDLRNCVLATAERNYARGHSGNVSATLQAVRNTLEPLESTQARYRARVRDWNLSWKPETIRTLRVRFGTRGLEVAGSAERPTDAGELYHRLTTSEELPRLHLRNIRGNEVDGFEFRFVEETIDDLLRRGPDLDTVYARAREMGVDPVLRDVCPAQDDSPERLPPDDHGDWERTIRDLPGAWKFSGYESSRSTDRLESDLYRLSDHQEHWQTVEIEVRQDRTFLRIGNLIPDGEYEYRRSNPMPKRMRTLVGTGGVESWAKFDQCPRPLCGLRASELSHAGRAEIDYLTELIRKIDRLRSQLYDIQATAWMNGPAREGIECTKRVLGTHDSLRQFSLSHRGKLQVVVHRPPESSAEVESTLENCSSHSIVRTNGEVRLREPTESKPGIVGTRVAADLGTSKNLEPAVSEFEPRWATREFVDGAEQLRYLVQQRKGTEVGGTIERLRGRIRGNAQKLSAPHDFLDTFTNSLLAPPFANVEFAARRPVELGSGVSYHRLEFDAEASRTAARQFLTLLGNLQSEQLIVVERLRWKKISPSEPPRMHATLGVLSRE